MVETERLILLPLTYPQLLKYRASDHSLDEELGLNQTERTISPDLEEALAQTILPSVADKLKNYLFFTLWSVIVKAENRMVGDLCFIGEPNVGGEIQIGYGTYDKFRGMGYMTEAVGGMLKWAEKQPLVTCIIAGTEMNNVASAKVLQKNGFEKFAESGKLYCWRRNIKNHTVNIPIIV